MYSKLQFSRFKNVISRPVFRELQLMEIWLNFQNSCCTLKIRGLWAKLCMAFLLFLFWKKLSYLHEHKFMHSFQDKLNPLHCCWKELEATSHFLLWCPNYSDKRSILTASHDFTASTNLIILNSIYIKYICLEGVVKLKVHLFLYLFMIFRH